MGAEVDRLGPGGLPGAGGRLVCSVQFGVFGLG